METLNSKAIKQVLDDNGWTLEYLDGTRSYQFCDSFGNCFNTLNNREVFSYLSLLIIDQHPHILFPVKYWRPKVVCGVPVNVTDIKSYRVSFEYAMKVLLELRVFDEIVVRHGSITASLNGMKTSFYSGREFVNYYRSCMSYYKKYRTFMK